MARYFTAFCLNFIVFYRHASRQISACRKFQQRGSGMCSNCTIVNLYIMKSVIIVHCKPYHNSYIDAVFLFQNQPAENLIKDGAYRKWRCKQSGEQKAWVELQLDKTSCISALDIGNHGSAFIEVLVGRSGCSEDDYRVCQCKSEVFPSLLE